MKLILALFLGVSAHAGDMTQFSGSATNLTGPVTSVGAATTIVGPVPATAVDLSTVTTAIGLNVSKAGDTMTGQLTNTSSITATVLMRSPTYSALAPGGSAVT